jgi:hypothetical protein
LVVQHFHVALWLSQTLTVDRLTDDQSGDPGALRRTILRSDFLISTPGILASAIARGVIDKDVVASFGLVIVDEFDQFVVVDETDRGSAARYSDLWKRLITQLPADTRYLVKSATLGITNKNSRSPRRSKAKHKSDLIRTLLDPVAISIPEASYGAVAPYMPIQLSVLHDPNVSRLLDAVHNSKGQAHARLDNIIGPVDFRDVERRAPQLCKARVNSPAQIRSASGHLRSVQLSQSARQAFCAIANLMMMSQHLLEDLTKDMGVRFANCAVKTRSNEFLRLEAAPLLRDDRADDHFAYLRGKKTEALKAIVDSRSRESERGVIFTRTITLLEALKPTLRKAMRPIFELTGEKGDLERKTAIDEFRKSANGILLMTRTTGGRGLDLPFADYAVFYSPKTDAVTMWQEMSRIRSTVSSPKDIHVLCYGQREASALEEIATSLQAQGRRVTIEFLDIL